MSATDEPFARDPLSCPHAVRSVGAACVENYSAHGGEYPISDEEYPRLRGAADALSEWVSVHAAPTDAGGRERCAWTFWTIAGERLPRVPRATRGDA
jgi:hypothetical protein